MPYDIVPPQANKSEITFPPMLSPPHVIFQQSSGTKEKRGRRTGVGVFELELRRFFLVETA